MEIPVCQRVSLVYISLFAEFAGHKATFIPPLLAEGTQERLLEELIDWQFQISSMLTGWLADIPAVVVDGQHTAHLADPCRIEGTGKGLQVGKTSLTMGTVDGAESGTVLTANGKHTFPPSHDTYGQIPLLAHIDHPLFVQNTACCGREFTPQLLSGLLESFHLIDFGRSSLISIHTTAPPTAAEVAAEALPEEVERDEGIFDFDHTVLVFLPAT